MFIICPLHIFRVSDTLLTGRRERRRVGVKFTLFLLAVDELVRDALFLHEVELFLRPTALHGAVDLPFGSLGRSRRGGGFGFVTRVQNVEVQGDKYESDDD